MTHPTVTIMSKPVKMIKAVSQAFATVHGIHGPVTVAYIKETDRWRRDFLSNQAMTDFTAVVKKQASSGALGPEVTTVALLQVQHILAATDDSKLTCEFHREAPHQSQNNSRTHWTAFAIKNNDLAQGSTRHFV